VWLKDEEWHDEATQLLDKLLKRKQPVMGGEFASNLARLLRRELNLAEMEAEYGREVPLLRERERTIALFYAGVRAFEEGDPQQTRRLWAQVKRPKNPLVELDYYLLVAERRRLNRRASRKAEEAA
jgi:hypothetical protein